MNEQFPGFSRSLAEADDDDVYVGHAAGFAGPGEGLICEVDDEVEVGEEVVPKDTGLLALGDGVGGDKGDLDGGVIDVASSLYIPGGDVVEYACAGDAARLRG